MKRKPPGWRTLRLEAHVSTAGTLYRVNGWLVNQTRIKEWFGFLPFAGQVFEFWLGLPRKVEEKV